MKNGRSLSVYQWTCQPDIFQKVFTIQVPMLVDQFQILA